MFFVGGGNVGLIAGYHALQAGIEVAGLAEAMPQCGGYKVHADKLVRFGVPIYTSHTVRAPTAARPWRASPSRSGRQIPSHPGTEKTFAATPCSSPWAEPRGRVHP
jgi:hypothetical protein